MKRDAVKAWKYLYMLFTLHQILAKFYGLLVLFKSFCGGALTILGPECDFNFLVCYVSYQFKIFKGLILPYF
jgi:hypothetical protein